MAKKSFLDSVEVKTPCSESWNEMSGGDAVRFCSHCAKSVHNLSAMTRIEARKIVAQSNGKICVRYAKRPDGKMQTIDAAPLPTNKRATRIAAGVFGAALTLSAASAAYAQGEPIVPKQEKSAVQKSAKNKIDAASGSISGTVLDSGGAVIPSAQITLTDTKNGATKVGRSNYDGFYEFLNLAPSIYKIEVVYVGFEKLTSAEIEIKDAQNSKQDLNMQVGATTEIVGFLVVVEYKVEMLQAASSADKSRLRKLIAQGKNVNEKDADARNQTALHIAAETGDAEITRILLDAKAGANMTDDDGETPLMIAARDGHLQAVRILLEAGANVHLKDGAGKTAIQKTESEEIKTLLEQYGARR